ncbi:MAG: AAA family ATPase [Candidatus Korobacteraceae bacterium]|jgi:5-methylcytosine-specific restriction protein B
MSLNPLVQLVHSLQQSEWSKRNEAAFKALFGSPEGRYPKAAEKSVTLRAPEMSQDSGVPFAAYIHPANPTKGAYGGFSFVVFPANEAPCLVALVVGTQGLAPDEAILGRPGHARKAQAICAWLNKTFGVGEQIAWAKQDPTRTDLNVPDDLQRRWSAYKPVFDRYGKVLYAIFKPRSDTKITQQAVTALLDLCFEERGFDVNANCRNDRDEIRSNWFGCLMPVVTADEVGKLLDSRRFVILQGPPGTGKTRTALELLTHKYAESGRSIQFHPNTTYENVIGGLAPEESGTQLGLHFAPKPGFLMESAENARKLYPKPYLLHIDEINRADLAKILGEAIYLFEAKSLQKREIDLPYDFGEPFHNKLQLPDNLQVLGTMNSADRSIAIVDVAVRRRFAFVSLWPQMSVVEEHSCELMRDAFRRIVSVFIEHAGEDAFSLVPGHSYFLESDEGAAKESLRVNLGPLLEEYLAQGYVAGFAEQIRTYLQWLQTL